MLNAKNVLTDIPHIDFVKEHIQDSGSLCSQFNKSFCKIQANNSISLKTNYYLTNDIFLAFTNLPALN